MAVHQHVDQLFTRRSRIIAVAVRGLKQRLNILLADKIAEDVKFIIRETITGQQQRDGVRHRTIVFLLFNKLLKIVETVRIEQAQTGEVALKTQLLRVAVRSRTPGTRSASCSIAMYSRLGASSLQTRWCASSTTIRSHSASHRCSRRCLLRRTKSRNK